jgi:acetyl-CoA C-acetyltransferase
MPATINDVVILAGVRTAIGTFQGALKDIPPTALGATVIREALTRADLAPDQVGHVVLGHVINTEPRDMYLARVAAVDGGIRQETPALTLNRLCGSGLQAVVSAAQAIMLGDAEVAVAGGAESMSRAPHATQTIRSGVKMGETTFVDMMTGALSDPFGAGHMGVTAENVARRWEIGRDAQDALALESQRRAGRAIAEGRFAAQIVPIQVRRGRETVAFDTDEHPKPATTADALAGLRPAFQKDGTVTAGNASGVNDGAGAVVLMSAERATRERRRPIARIIGYAHAGVDPSLMGIGPVPAVRDLLTRTGLEISDFDVVESNEAFAAQACAVGRELGFDPARTNPNGGAIALGHPIGASGAIILVKALYELQRTGGRRALCTMCIGGGQGIAVAIEAAS